MGSVPNVQRHIDAVTTDILNIRVIHDGLEWAVPSQVPYYIVEDPVPFIYSKLSEASVILFRDDLSLFINVLLGVDVFSFRRCELLAEYIYYFLICIPLFF